MPHLEGYRLALTERATLVTGDVYELTIPLEAPPSARDPLPRRGMVKTHLSALDTTITKHDLVTRTEGTVMLRLSLFELDLIASLIHEARSNEHERIREIGRL